MNDRNYKSAWDCIKTIVNETPIGDIITRKIIRERANNIVQASYAYGINKYSTLDNYRNMLCNHNILKKVGLGAYIKLHNIPDDVSLTTLLSTRYDSPLYRDNSSSIFDWV